MKNSYTQEQKILFAKALAECKFKPFDAGELMFPDDNQEARAIAFCLGQDREVLNIARRINTMNDKSSEVENFVKERLEYLAVNAYEEKEQLKALELLMNLHGLNRKGTETNTNVSLNPAVIQVDSISDWEEEFLENQKGLMNR